jgi:hypothetical protein
MGVCVVAVDIGSVRPPPKFAWAAFDAPGRDLVNSGTSPGSAVSALVPGLLAGAQAALLLEAPMSVPVPGGAQLLLAEAFITASGKPEPLPAGQHTADAVAAGLALVEILDSSAPLVSSVCCWPRDSFSVLAAMALWAGRRIDAGEPRAEVLVVAARPRHEPSSRRIMDAAPGADG